MSRGVRSPLHSPLRLPVHSPTQYKFGARIVLSAYTVDDDAIVGTAIGTLSVENSRDVYEFTIVSDPDSKFELDIVDYPTLRLIDTVSYETAVQHSVTIEADNGVDDPISQTFTIVVNNIAEPVISLSSQTISETASITDAVGEFIITGGTGDATDYTFTVTADPDSKFVVDETNTHLRLRATLDYNVATSHSVTVQADDGVHVPVSQQFTITVTEVAAGTIVLTPSTVAENASVGALVGNLSVVDGSGSYTFSITADPDSKFAIDGVDNTRLELANTLDYETATFHSVTIEADNGVDTPISDTLSVLVSNVQEGTTLVDLTLDTLTMPENTAFGTPVGTLTGMAVGSTLSLYDSAGARFALDGDVIEAGLIPTDHSTTTSHSITVRETLADATNSPHDTVFVITISNAAPVLSALVVTPIAPDYTAATISLNTTDGDGTMYFVVTPTFKVAPSAEQIVAGFDGDGIPATWAGSVAVSGIDTYAVGPSGMIQNAVYDCYVVQYDASDVVSNIATVEFTSGETVELQYLLGGQFPAMIQDDGVRRQYAHAGGFFNGAGTVAAAPSVLVPGSYTIAGTPAFFINDDLASRQAMHGTTYVNGASA